MNRALPSPARPRKTSALPLAMKPSLAVLVAVAGFCAVLAAAPMAGQSGSKNPHGALKTECGECHSMEGWSPLKTPLPFQHATTGFDLAGAHSAATCKACHATLDFSVEKGKSDCFACHQSAFTRATRPSHTGFPTACKNCHGVTAWQPATFDHSQTRFQLHGAHRTVDCISCHRNGYTATPSECFTCHQKDFGSARNPSHAGFSTSCEDCHGVAAWQPATFDHNQTNFQLNGAHRTVDCVTCHRTGYAGTPSECFSCHQNDFTSARNPSHAGFANTCQDCHGVTAWQPAIFDHNATGFQLNGAHRTAPCTACHQNGYVGTPSECFACHQSDYNGARNPSHAGFLTTCQSCHSVTAWQPATFDHNATGFQLAGAHRSASCTSCHRSGYAGTSSECFSCHQSNYNAARNPSHAGFPTSCQNCHGVTAWQPASFDHNTTGFQLNGAHRSASCTSCHRSGYAGTSSECFACHQSNYNAARNPSHAGFPTSCQNCHSVTAWQPASFDHNTTGFQLAGAHRSVACTSCHRTGYSGTPSECVACHQSDYSAARNPSHAGFPTTCQNCHSVTAWQPASFDHNTTGFQLNGAHRTVACTSCHQSGYAGTPSACFACHQSDYNGTRNPNHASAGFPTSCEDCHSTNGWTPASFNHENFFPIASGRHQFPCTSCHVSPGNYGIFECILCHEHSQGETNDDHRGVGGYIYESHACYQCHPRGRE